MSSSAPSSVPDFQLLFAAAPGLLLAVRPDDDFHIAAASDSYLRATMTRREDIVGRPIFDVFPDNPDDPAATGVQGVRAAFERVRAERAHIVMPVYQHDIRRPEADGGGFEQRFWQTSVWPVPAAESPAGPLSYLLCRVEEVTTRITSDRERDDAHIRLEATHAAAEMGTWIWDVETNRVHADQHLARMFGVSLADAHGGPVENYLLAIHPDDREQTKEAIRRSVEDAASYVVEYRLALPDGNGYRWVVARGWAERDERGRVRRFPGVVLDVTERKLAEQALAENEERLRIAIDSARLGTFDFDPQAGVLMWSPACRAMFGVSSDETVSYESTFCRILHPEDRDRTMAAVKEALRPGGDGRYNIEYRIIAPDGSEHWIAAAGRGFFDSENRPHRFIGTVLDITERKLAEQAADRRSAQLQKLAVIAGRLNAAHDVRSVLGILTEEARQLIGVRQSVMQANAVVQPADGAPLTVVSRPDAGPLPDAGRGEVGGGGGELSAPLIGRNGQPLGTIELISKADDIFGPDDAALLTQLSQIAAGAIENARLYEELRGNDQRKDEFLAMLAHELRNPLSAIRNAVALSSGEQAPAEDIAWSMEVIQRQLHQLTRLIDDLLDVSRITRGKVQLRKEYVDAAQIVRRAVDAVNGLIEEHRHELTVSVRAAALPLEGDPARLEQIFVNLLTNAARYTEKGGRIVIDAARDNGHVVIRVKDNGMGIPPEKLPQVFELFTQGDRALARSEGGLGVGLTIVRSLTELHGGTVHAHSEGAGRGSEFVVRLPAASTSSAPRSPVATGPSVAAASPAKLGRVLVVDDNEDSARGTAMILKRAGYETRLAYDGPCAVEVAREFRPEFVLLDIGLPGMDGYEVARCLRGEDGLPGVKLVALSGYGQESDRRRAREAGFDHHLVKPVEPDKLLAWLREAAGGIIRGAAG